MTDWLTDRGTEGKDLPIKSPYWKLKTSYRQSKSAKWEQTEFPNKVSKKANKISKWNLCGDFVWKFSFGIFCSEISIWDF